MFSLVIARPYWLNKEGRRRTNEEHEKWCGASNQVLRLHSLGAIKSPPLLRFHLSNWIWPINIMNQRSFTRRVDGPDQLP
ncbi:hypothetical protein SRHO_G00333660 [Serrasalmus rhombeus]